MKQQMIIILLLLISQHISLDALSSSKEGWFFDYQKTPESGWHFYNETDIKKSTPEEASPTSSLEASEKALAVFKQHMEQVKARMVMDPTQENVRVYQRLQQQVQERASEVATVWQKNLLKHPSLDERIKRPPSSLGGELFMKLRDERRTALIHSLKDRYGIFYIFSASCPYCQEMGDIVLAFAQKYHFEVLPLIVGDGMDQRFPDAKEGGAFIKTLGIKALPALVAYDSHTQQALPLAFGLKTLDEIEDQIMVSYGGVL